MSSPPSPGDITDADLDEVARLLGYALFQAQYMEYMLVTLYGASFGRLGRQHPREVMAKRFHDPLGVLIRDLGTIDVDRALTELLRSALALRNDLVHRFYKHFAPLAVSHPVLREAQTYLQNAHHAFETTAQEITQEVERRLIDLRPDGWDLREAIDKAAEDYRLALEKGERPADLW